MRIVVALFLVLLATPAMAQWHHGGGWGGPGWGGPGWHHGWHGGWGGGYGGGYGFVPIPVPAPYEEDYVAPVRSCWWSHRYHRRVCTED